LAYQEGRCSIEFISWGHLLCFQDHRLSFCSRKCFDFVL